jgi:hypothetical protein
MKHRSLHLDHEACQDITGCCCASLLLLCSIVTGWRLSCREGQGATHVNDCQ